MSEGPVLVVEDYFVVAELCRSLLERHRFTVAGPVPSVSQALSLLEGAERPAAAILDVSLRGKLVTPVAQRLRELDIPFVFLTASRDLEVLGEEFRDHPKVEKPPDEEILLDAVRSMLDS